MTTWMVVEDEPDLYETLLVLFDIWGVDGVAFTTGTDAVSWIDDIDAGNIQTNIPELAILDIRLPGVSGDEVGQRLRASLALKDIAIVLTTAYHLSSSEEKTVLKNAQTKHLVYKPFPEPGALQTLLKNAIASHNAANDT